MRILLFTVAALAIFGLGLALGTVGPTITIGENSFFLSEVKEWSAVPVIRIQHQHPDQIPDRWILEWSTSGGHRFQAVIVGSVNMADIVKKLDESTRRREKAAKEKQNAAR